MSTSRQPWLDSHPSLAHSMEDFEARDFSPTIAEIPSQHSGFRSSHGHIHSSEYSEAATSSSTRRSYSPPVWRQAGSGWFKHQQVPSPSRRHKDTSPLDQSADEGDDVDMTACRVARRIPLPESPVKGRTPSGSPDPDATGADVTPHAERGRGGGGGGAGGVESASRYGGRQAEEQTGERESALIRSSTPQNYIRFSTSLDVVQRTEPIEAVVVGVRKAIRHVTASRYNTFFYAIATLLLYWVCANLLSTPLNGPSPDLIKVAGLAKSFEPVIYYSENGHAQIGQLQETGVAVWDLGESVRGTNMTSAPLIVRQLDDLSDSLKTLAMELTRFFAGVDADIDSILIVMEWAQRELTAVSAAPPSTISSAWSNAHALLSRAGLLSDSRLLRDLLGQTYQQRTHATLERAFHEFLSVLEESINNELNWSIQLFQLFEAVDSQFLNLQRTVIREQDQQEQLENDFLSSLWTKVIGADPAQVRKYERNRDLLRSVRERTVQNKHVLQAHNQRLQQLKSALEQLRRRLVSPLLRSANASTALPVAEQIRGLDDTYRSLRASRDAQKQKMLEIVYGAGTNRVALPAGVGNNVVESRRVELGDGTGRQ